MQLQEIFRTDFAILEAEPLDAVEMVFILKVVVCLDAEIGSRGIGIDRSIKLHLEFEPGSVEAIASIESVVPLSALQGIVSIPTGDRIVTSAPGKGIVSPTAIDQVVKIVMRSEEFVVSVLADEKCFPRLSEIFIRL